MRQAATALPQFATVAEQDFSHWSTRELSARLAGLRHERAGTTVVIGRLVVERSEIHASIKEKRGVRALYYDLDLMCTWEGHCAIGRGSEPPGCIKGEFRLYNVGQDTKFQDGGDEATSYLFSLGFPLQYQKDEECELWARQIKFEAQELFDRVSEVVSTWVTDLIAKAAKAK